MAHRKYIRVCLLILGVGAALAAAVLLRRAATSGDSGLLVRARPGKPGRYEGMFEVMGTDARLEVAAPSLKAAGQMIEAAAWQVRVVQQLMSTYEPDSEIGRLNRFGHESPVELSEHTVRVLRAAAEVSGLTGGAFDVTYAPLRTLWRGARDEERVPTDDAVHRALAAVGYGKLILEDGTARFAAARMEVDLGGIAKGYAIDLAAEALQNAGAPCGIVDVGGDLRLFGLPEPNGRWLVEMRRPPGVSDRIVLRLPPCGVATSGDYARGFRIGQRSFSHIIDPRTGWPVAEVPSVTVVAPEATTADALATALSVMGAAEGIPLVDSLPGIECMIMMRQPDGTVRKYPSKGFRSLVENQ